MKMQEVRQISLNLIDTQFKCFFTTKRLTDKVLAVKLGIPESEVMRNKKFNDMKSSISRQLITVIIELKQKGFIEKRSNRAWEIKKRGFV